MSDAKKTGFLPTSMGNQVMKLIVIAVSAAAVSGCEKDPEELSTTERALSELQSKYDELVAGKIDDPVKWASDDLENIGDWEYKILDVANLDAAAMEETLNEWGDERWEVFWIERIRNDYRVMLKRPSRSYLSRIPLSQIGRFVIGNDDSEP